MAEQQQDFDVDGLIGSLQQPEPPQVPEKFGEIEAPAFFQGLEAATGGEVKDYDTFQNVLNRAKEADGLRSRIQEFEQAQQQNPFADDLSKQINDLRASGVPVSQIRDYLELSEVDVASIGDEAAIKKMIALNNPGYDSAEQQVLLNQKLGFDLSEYDSNDVAMRVKMKELANEAKTFLESKKLNVSQSAQTEHVQALQRKAQSVGDAWGKVLPEIAKSDAIDLSFTDDSINTDFKYSPSKEVQETAMKMALQVIQSSPDAYAPTKENLDTVRGLYQQFVMLQDFNAIKESLIKDTWARATQLLTQKQAGAPPAPPGVPTTRVQPTNTGGLPDAAFL